ncbi:MAG: D-glycero-beta-D-manno-heptose-7-phosphate kinase [Odoribacter sp.]
MKSENLNFSNSKILIIGDVMLDKYYFGQVERISPEAPVPIVNIRKEESRLGGASNVANNIASLGGQTLLCGTIGHDFFGREVERICKQKNIKTALIKTLCPTITKARIIGGKQQIVRVDYEEKAELEENEKKQLKETINKFLPSYDVLVISDYGKGLISEDFCHYLIKIARKYEKQIIVDPKGKNWKKYTGADIVTPNVKELSDIIGYTIPNTDRAIEKAAREVIDANRLTSLLVTRSDKGMSFIGNSIPIHIPTHSEEVFDVSGAGDTVVAILSICLAAGFDLVAAIETANIAAGIVVKKIGTATLSIEELQQQLDNRQ